jgi:isopentenyl phosphate kinase
MSDLLFLKLGGSLITDKTGVEAARVDVLARVAAEIAAARAENPGLQLVLGHGSGSFGHVAAAAQKTRQGVDSAEQWLAFARVSDAAARLNRLVVGALLAAGLPAIGLQPSASVDCREGAIRDMAVKPVARALAAGLLPVVYGDVAFDDGRGGTIVSTEEVLVFLAGHLRPSWFLLAGETPGVLDEAGAIVPLITVENLPAILPALGASRGTDVTGGMSGKVRDMLSLVEAQPELRVRIFSGMMIENVTAVLRQPSTLVGTEISTATTSS